MSKSPTPAVDVDGYAAAFYELADIMGLPAMPDSPANVWRDIMKPRLEDVVRLQKERDVAVRWANQSVDMLKDAFFPVADALRALEAYLRNTPHHNALEAAAARKALRRFDDPDIIARHRIASTPKLPDDAAVERLREALDTAAWNMQTLATDIRNPGQRALADKWIAAARAALAAPEEKTNVE